MLDEADVMESTCIGERVVKRAKPTAPQINILSSDSDGNGDDDREKKGSKERQSERDGNGDAPDTSKGLIDHAGADINVKSVDSNLANGDVVQGMAFAPVRAALTNSSSLPEEQWGQPYQTQELKRWHMDRAALTIISQIGEGEFGALFKAQHRTADSGGLARHASLVFVCSLDNSHSDEAREAFLYNSRLLMRVAHENVIRLIGISARSDPWRLIVEVLNNFRFFLE